LIEERWQGLLETGEEATELAINLGRLSLEIHWNRPPIDVVRSDLERAAALDPNDDRVWLGQANLAVRSGSLDVAERLLDACLKRRPQDNAVWRARLQWGMAANRPDAVRAAKEHLPASELTAPESNRVEAWLAASQGDRTREREALERVVMTNRADLATCKRLAELARQDGQPERANELERRPADIAGMNERLHKLYERNQPLRDALETGQLAEQLGHSFVAKVFLTVAAAKSLHAGEARQLLTELTSREHTR
jgi:tetratricopeptide (TPR) repeat protein